MRRLAALFAALIALASPAAAVADGDPASDVLLGQTVFLPYAPISPTAQRRLYAVTAAAAKAGYPLRVALIGARSDLGVVPALFGKPGQYARFLSSELTGVVNGPVLVVMPSGFGLAARGNALSTGSLAAVSIGSGTDGLGTAAVTATERLAAAAGHPLPAGAASAQAPSPGASSATVRSSLIAIGILVALALVGLSGAAAARARLRGRGREPAA
ncbi:MAG TPA: hypothetical protein VGI87_05425 [Solirubrobacteraceae bacterium]|jgi:hypothetical protein